MRYQFLLVKHDDTLTKSGNCLAHADNQVNGSSAGQLNPLSVINI